MPDYLPKYVETLTINWPEPEIHHGDVLVRDLRERGDELHIPEKLAFLRPAVDYALFREGYYAYNFVYVTVSHGSSSSLSRPSLAYGDGVQYVWAEAWDAQPPGAMLRIDSSTNLMPRVIGGADYFMITLCDLP